MTLSVILIFLFLGVVLMLAEVLVIPGVGIAGVSGLLLLILAIYFAYEIDNYTGHWTLAAASISSIGLLILSLRANTWKKVALAENITGKSKEDYSSQNFSVGDKGFTTSRLAPIGNARINGNIVEVSTRSEFIDEDKPIEILKIEKTKITVKQI